MTRDAMYSWFWLILAVGWLVMRFVDGDTPQESTGFWACMILSVIYGKSARR